MKKLSFIVAFLCCSMSLGNAENCVSTSAPNGLFEIIQSPLVRKYTIKLDKETGTTWQMVKDGHNNICWERLYRESAIIDRQIPGKINYQIFMGGLAAADMFMINTNSGEIWQLCQGRDGIFWSLTK